MVGEVSISGADYERRPSLLTTSNGAGRKRRPPKRIQQMILKRNGSLCAYCDAYLLPAEYTWDHITPYAYLGANPDNNWALACRRCNSRKGSLVFASAADARDYLSRTAA